MACWGRSASEESANQDYWPSSETKTLDFRGFDAYIILILRGGILMSIGKCPEMLSQLMLVGIILVGRLGVSEFNFLGNSLWT